MSDKDDEIPERDLKMMERLIEVMKEFPEYDFNVVAQHDTMQPDEAAIFGNGCLVCARIIMEGYITLNGIQHRGQLVHRDEGDKIH